MVGATAIRVELVYRNAYRNDNGGGHHAIIELNI